MKGTRILRYIGNRPKPEDNPFSLDEYLRDMPALPTYANVTSASAPVEKKEVPQDEFEVNLVEPLTGWRAWWLDDNDMLRSLNQTDFCWPWEKRAEAECEHYSKHIPPVEACTCGFYAVDSKFQLREHGYVGQNGLVVGLIYGWGRYVRGDKGFRCQYAYPRCFYLDDATSSFVNKLTRYRVPIYFSQPMQVYSPSEHGYEHGYWENETDGDFRTGERSRTAEEASASEEDCPF